ncbi:PIG-L deacetylase family protein [Naumannella halotolerans]|uniref:N-acetyl-1-D-myo-inositol-2-amino-2-deoxy-alpha-D-glucopyranoside deacetylase n=1 Tax=Naumannella halotolerans TaxID=993414 RepID=A0A4R7J2J1_9ACTN|nr:PIG-L family deacetylase [Naumannella halotolerans]TDT31304.1 N-acetyl-1-D-myo-inositol-2-amino-2-deoxy-alpha-D-glucopyranoside deacetylase [Naumannella halotolerans]
MSQQPSAGASMINRAEPFVGVQRVLFLHAHPDDETIATGALIAALNDAGVEVFLLTATRGEQGEIVAGSLPPELTGAELSAARGAELAAALDALGGVQHAYLGEPPARAESAPPRQYADSGMEWMPNGLAGPGPDSGPDALTSAAEEEVLADLRAMIDFAQPDLIITYDEIGGYGHPDHVRLHTAGLRAGREAGVPVAEILDSSQVGEGTHWFELDGYRDVLVEALRCHRSQLSVVGDHIVHVGGQPDEIRTRIGLRRID